jgi:hypothetical protein
MAVPNIKQILDAVYTKLNADTALKALLGDGVIYSGIVVKGTATRPYVLIRSPQGLSDVGAKNLNMWEFDLEVLVVTNEEESSVVMENIIDYILEDLHRTSLSLTDNHILTECNGLTPVPSGDDLAATVLNFKVLFANTAS